MIKTLWRASDEPGYFGTWSCWSARKADALRYMDNPGFGGNVLYRAQTTDEVPFGEVLDLTNSRDEWADLHDALYPRARVTANERYERYDRIQDWRSGCSYIWEVWENSRELSARLLVSGYTWIVYSDNYPDNAETWCYLGEGSLPVNMMALRLTGEVAIDYARENNSSVNLSGDMWEDPREGLTPDEATDEDPDRIWILAKTL